MEEQKLQLRRKKEELDLETELAAFNAKLAILENYDVSSTRSERSNGMNSYFEREKGKVHRITALNPMANEFKSAWMPPPQNHQPELSLPPDKSESMDVVTHKTRSASCYPLSLFSHYISDITAHSTSAYSSSAK